ncbi:hypothetical protein [Psychroflexus sp. MES1-P1E]|uniref:hypothetical protein n=1 Tax=Psychroflexus sp. MES1-P1E TaxID=2058320 RepID=UPI0011AE9473|nr:hypothetical protein [Psychroflexus sp. MES1-P1E]
MIKKTFNLYKFGQKVRILSTLELKKEGINDYVVIDKLEVKKDTTDFEISYKIEGAGSGGKFVKENGEWKVLDYSVWEN